MASSCAAAVRVSHERKLYHSMDWEEGITIVLHRLRISLYEVNTFLA